MYHSRTGERYRSGRFRNGHTIVGDILIHKYWFHKPIDVILPRWTIDDTHNLDRLKQKEWNMLRLDENINIITLDDMIFKNKTLENRLKKFMDVLPLLKEALIEKNKFIKELKNEFKHGNIKINRKQVEENKQKGMKLILAGR